MMFQGAETGVMSTEDKTKHNGNDEPKQQNKSSHGNEVKYFTHCNTPFQFFVVLTSPKKVYLRRENRGIQIDSSLTQYLWQDAQFDG